MSVLNMSSKLKIFMKNITYTFISKFITTIISVMMILIVPKFLDVNEYGYWQLYIFYLNYIGLLGIGWSDGIYLKIGGYKYTELNKSLLISQFWLMTLVQIIFTIIFILFSVKLSSDDDKLYILIVTAISGFFLIIRSLFYYVLEATNRIKEFALINLIDRLIYMLFTIIILLLNLGSYKPLIIVDLIAKIITIIVLIYLCKDIVFGKLIPLKSAIEEAKSNINIGIKLLLANVASTLIIGIVRWAIEKQWDIGVFGKVSLTLSIANLFMVFVNVFGIVLYPMLRQTSRERLPSLYKQMRTLIIFPLLGILIFYYPLTLILNAWLPQYSESVLYLGLLFPIFVYESKISILINTYLKVLRKEKLILFVNLLTLTLSIVSTLMLVFILKNLILTVLSITILLAFRCIIAEFLLAKYLEINVTKDMLIEFLLTTVFIIFSWYLDGLISSFLYLIVYTSFFIIKLKDIREVLENMKNKSKNKM